MQHFSYKSIKCPRAKSSFIFKCCQNRAICLGVRVLYMDFDLLTLEVLTFDFLKIWRSKQQLGIYKRFISKWGWIWINGFLPMFLNGFLTDKRLYLCAYAWNILFILPEWCRIPKNIIILSFDQIGWKATSYGTVWVFITDKLFCFCACSLIKLVVVILLTPQSVQE